MNIKLYKYIFFLLLNQLYFTCYAADAFEKEIQADDLMTVIRAHTFEWLPPSNEEQPKPVQTILSVADEALRVSREHSIPPARISIVFDLDGTLTQCRDPKTSSGAAEANDAVKEILQFLIEQKFHIVISSAWHIFEESVIRLRELELSHLIAGSSSKGKLIVKQDSFSNETYTEFEYTKLGHAVSVKNLAESSSSNPYYRAKAMAAYLADPEHAQQIEYILFADDNASNTKAFVKDIKRFPVYKNLGDYATYLIQSSTCKRDEERISFVESHLAEEQKKHEESHDLEEKEERKLGGLRELRLSMKKSFYDLPDFSPKFEEVSTSSSSFTTSWFKTNGSETPLSSSPTGQDCFLTSATPQYLSFSQDAVAPGVPAKIQSGHATPKSPLSRSIDNEDFQDQTLGLIFVEKLTLSSGGDIEG